MQDMWIEDPVFNMPTAQLTHIGKLITVFFSTNIYLTQTAFGTTLLSHHIKYNRILDRFPPSVKDISLTQL